LEIRIGAREVKCIGVSPPHDHTHVNIDMGERDAIAALTARPGSASIHDWGRSKPIRPIAYTSDAHAAGKGQSPASSGAGRESSSRASTGSTGNHMVALEISETPIPAVARDPAVNYFGNVISCYDGELYGPLYSLHT
jgi:hypothetical protein